MKVSFEEAQVQCGDLYLVLCVSERWNKRKVSEWVSMTVVSSCLGVGRCEVSHG